MTMSPISEVLLELEISDNVTARLLLVSCDRKDRASAREGISFERGKMATWTSGKAVTSLFDSSDVEIMSVPVSATARSTDETPISAIFSEAKKSSRDNVMGLVTSIRPLRTIAALNSDSVGSSDTTILFTFRATAISVTYSLALCKSGRRLKKPLTAVTCELSIETKLSWSLSVEMAYSPTCRLCPVRFRISGLAPDLVTLINEVPTLLGR